MSRSYVVFCGVEGKLDVLHVECRRCQRKGRYSVAKLIERYGRKGNMMMPRAAQQRLSEALRSTAT
jgi:hypothetical protein